jgi:hypothetical protein
LIRLGPNTVFVITQHNNMTFCPKRKKILVLFDSQYTHSGYCFRSAFLPKSRVFTKSDFLISGKALNVTLLFIIALELSFPIRMGDSKVFK